MDKTAIRNAATVVVLRKTEEQTFVLMGQRGEKAAFMPNKYVFPGGRLTPKIIISHLPAGLPNRVYRDWLMTAIQVLSILYRSRLFVNYGKKPV